MTYTPCGGPSGPMRGSFRTTGGPMPPIRWAPTPALSYRQEVLHAPSI